MLITHFLGAPLSKVDVLGPSYYEIMGRPGKLGAYEILAPLGAGGMGEVYRARDLRLKRDVAVKILPAKAVLDPDRRKRFEQEAQAASALNHPNILTVHDFGA